VRAARGSGVAELRTVAELAQTLAGLEDEDLGRLHTAYTRAARITAKSAAEAAPALRPELLLEEAERDVARTLQAVDVQVAGALGSYDVVAAIGAATKLGPPVDRFFDDVLVMAEDHEVRANRLRLLLDVRDTIGRLGDLSQIPR
jgi:glycyl-tRNA synthetase beta chain